jgi:hypothetical protein
MSGPNDGRYFGPHGELRDFERRPGDPRQRIPAAARRWAGISLIKNANSNPQNRKTLIDTGDFGETCSVNIQLRFAFDANNSEVQPILPWDPVYRGDGTIRVSIRRGLDTLSNVIEETTDIRSPVDLAPFGDGDQLGLDIVEARNLSISVEMTHGLSDVWVQAVATVVEQIGTRDRVVGWERAEQRTIAAANAATQLAKARPGRVQYLVVNTSTNANLFVGKDNAVSALNAMLVLPGGVGRFSHYESPVGGYRGELWGFWDVGAPNGNALVTEGFYY